MSWIKATVNFLRNSVLFLVSLLIAFVVLDALLRVVLGGFTGADKRILFYTDPSFVKGANGEIRYEKHSRIRMVALYGSNIDYDVTHMTNNVGLMDLRDYSPVDEGQTNIAYVGDSFTASSGGNFQWVEALNTKLVSEPYFLHNLGVAGTGFEQFYKILNSLSRDFEYVEVNVVAISHDFFRSYWYPEITEGGVKLCFDNVTRDECRKNSNITMHRISHDQTHLQLLEKASELYEKADGKKVWFRKSPVIQMSCRFIQDNLYKDFLKKNICRDFRNLAMRKDVENERFLNSIEYLKLIKRDYPESKVRLIHVPEKAEVNEGTYSIKIDSHMEKIGIEYVPVLYRCSWDVSMFHEFDAHPNDSGYENLTDCVYETIYQKVK